MARIKYYNNETNKWEYADSAFSGGNVQITIPDSGGNPTGGGMSATASALLITILRNGVYSTDQSANITALAEALTVTEPEQPEEPDTPVEPDEPVVPEVTLTSISATYSGGDVAVGTAVTDLTGVVVTAHYSDGTSETVTGYTLSGTIAEGSNTVTVSYSGKTATFTVTGVAESGGDEPAGLTYSVQNVSLDGTSGIDTGIAPFSTDHDWTIACKFLYTGSGSRAYLWAATTSKWGSVNGLGAKLIDDAWFGEGSVAWISACPAGTIAHCVFTHAVGGGMTCNTQLYKSDGTKANYYSGTAGDGTQIVTTTENLLIGTNKPQNTYLTGEIYDFQLLDTVWDADTISAYLARE